MRWLLDYASQQAAGYAVWGRDTDHIEKGFVFGGMPARSGVTAALLVASGWTGVDDVFSGEDNFFRVNAPDGDPNVLVAALGERFEVVNTDIKKWTVGTPIQAPLDAIENLRAQRAFDADDVTSVVVRLAPTVGAVVNNRDIPDICLQHMVAVMLIDETASFHAAHDKARMRDAAVLRQRAKVTYVPDESLAPLLPARVAVVEITLDRRHASSADRVEAVRGTVRNPMTREEVVAKALDLIAPVLGTGNRSKLIDAVLAIETLRDRSRAAAAAAAIITAQRLVERADPPAQLHEPRLFEDGIALIVDLDRHQIGETRVRLVPLDPFHGRPQPAIGLIRIATREVGQRSRARAHASPRIRPLESMREPLDFFGATNSRIGIEQVRDDVGSFCPAESLGVAKRGQRLLRLAQRRFDLSDPMLDPGSCRSLVPRDTQFRKGLLQTTRLRKNDAETPAQVGRIAESHGTAHQLDSAFVLTGPRQKLAETAQGVDVVGSEVVGVLVVAERVAPSPAESVSRGAREVSVRRAFIQR